MRIWLLIGLIAWVAQSGCTQSYPERDQYFVRIRSVIPDIKYEIRYAGKNNFLGRPVTGYQSAEAWLTKEAAQALKGVQKELNSKGLGLKIFDAYRPQRAVDDFVAWAKVLSDTVNKRAFYPDVPKSQLFQKGFIASRSGHTRGSTLDLTLIYLDSGKEVDMGGPYDFFGPVSHHDYKGITAKQMENRILLKTMMSKHGFKPYDVEWWHYTLRDEPFPERYFDFPVLEK